MKPGSPQNKLVRDFIYEALLLLLKDKDFKDISITEIVTKAGVSRMAYYRNFNSKEQIIDSHLDELFQHYIEESINHQPADVHQLAKTFFAYFRRHELLITNLINSNITFLLLDHFAKNMRPLLEVFSLYPAEDSIADQYKAHFFTGGIFNILIEWSKRSMVESDEEMARLVIALLLPDRG